MAVIAYPTCRPGVCGKHYDWLALGRINGPVVPTNYVYVEKKIMLLKQCWDKQLKLSVWSKTEVTQVWFYITVSPSRFP